MKSAKPGKHTSAIEIQNISPFGIWLLIHEIEYFASFEDFPWFKNAKIEDIFNVQEEHPGHLYWPSLDIDLSVQSLVHPEQFPLVAKSRKRAAPKK